jgi:hypothetical protein
MRRGHLIAVVETFLLGCAALPIVVGCSGVRSEAPREGQGHTKATKEQTRSPGATRSEQARCKGTWPTRIPRLAEGTYITNDLPGCHNKGGLLLGTDKHGHRVDQLAGKDGDDEIRGLGGPDYFYGGPGNDTELGGGGDGQRDEIYCGKGRDSYTADKLDYVDSSCEEKTRATSAMA